MGQTQGNLNKMEKKERKRLKKLQKLNKEKRNHQVKDKKRKKKEKDRKNKAEGFVDEKADLELKNKTDFTNSEVAVEPYTLDVDEDRNGTRYAESSYVQSSENGTNMFIEINGANNHIEQIVAEVGEENPSGEEEHSFMTNDTETMQTKEEDKHITDLVLHKEDESSDYDDDTVVSVGDQPDVERVQEHDMASVLDDPLPKEEINKQVLDTTTSVKDTARKPSGTEIVRNSYLNKLPELYKIELQENLIKHAIPNWYRRNQENWRSQEHPEFWKVGRDQRWSSSEWKTDMKNVTLNGENFVKDTKGTKAFISNNSLNKSPAKVVFNLNGTLQNAGSSNSGSLTDKTVTDDLDDESLTDEAELTSKQRHLHIGVANMGKSNAKTEFDHFKAKERNKGRLHADENLDSSDLKSKYREKKKKKDMTKLREWYHNSERADHINREKGGISHRQKQKKPGRQDPEKAHLRFFVFLT